MVCTMPCNVSTTCCRTASVIGLLLSKASNRDSTERPKIKQKPDGLNVGRASMRENDFHLTQSWDS